MFPKGSSEESLTLKGLTCLRYHEMDHRLRMFFERKKGNTFKTLRQQSKLHYSKALKNPIQLKNDISWHKQKLYRQNLRLELNNKLSVDYFEIRDGVPHYRGEPLNNAMTDNDENPESLKMKHLLKNFNEKQFAIAEISHIYNQALEYNKFTLSPQKRVKTQQNIQTQRNHISFEPKLKNKGSAIEFVNLLAMRKRSFTTIDMKKKLSNNFPLKKRLSKKSSTLNTSSNQKNSTQQQSIIKLVYEFNKSVHKLKQMLRIKPLQQITKHKLQNEFISRYGHEILGLPLYIGINERIHLKSTLQNLSKIPLSRVHKICFLYFDMNKNGVIDELDLFELLKMVDKVALLQKDYNTFTNYLAKLNHKVYDEVCAISTPRNRITHNHDEKRQLTKLTLPQEMQEIKVYEQEFTGSPNPHMFTILKNESKEEKKIQLNFEIQKLIGINYERFKQIFKNEPPFFFLDLLEVFFGMVRVTHQDSQFLLYRNKQGQHHNHGVQQQISKSMVSPNVVRKLEDIRKGGLKTIKSISEVRQYSIN